MMNFQNFEVLSFDCYGTLINWENGILSALKTILYNHNIHLRDNEILELFAQQESIQESGDYLKYRDVLKNVVHDFGKRFNFTPTESEVNALAESIQNWEPFPDTVKALKALKTRYKLTIISNIDDELFAYSAKKLEVEFDWLITAEQVKSYKPSVQNFEIAIQRMGINPDKLLHVAQSIYHDIVPAKTMGITAVWVNRRKGQEGFGATVAASSNPDLEVPDLQSLVSLMGLD
ncbi:haloacid dehalogenase type II [Allocoleopsis franciscana]|uniref:2-haloalkanoic acid dehalogenase, type II n=1 Tax=Allocoleopsis franciscana PCC 7113 TaxID=1173027 RepID=K9WFF7_9CYAN|nr:haloacid dehalogenase type II [Allocoleopsis franciscana]AFZ18953.1 2-haloalkanoic acid dehalogenase, type II [Allocoleopsis franciscana PCC 7113]